MKPARLLRLISTIACTAVVSSCGDATSPLSNELATQRHRWESANVDDYQYTYRALCFCLPIDSVRVLVVADSVRSAVRLSTGEQYAPSIFPTVEALFKVIDDAIAAKREVHATYDATYGFPREIDLPGRPGYADDGATYFITDFSATHITLDPR